MEKIQEGYKEAFNLLKELHEWVSKSASIFVYPNSDLEKRVSKQLEKIDNLPLENKDSQRYACPFCGNDHGQFDHYCRSCGKSLSGRMGR